MAPHTFASTGEGLSAGEGGGLALSPGWPDFASNARDLLAPLLACASPGEFLALQRRVDMPRLVRVLDDWSAVRLGAQGPVREDAAPLLQRKRADFLVSVCERYGLVHAEVFALFVLHSAHDDEVDAVLRLLAEDKRLGQTLARMPTVRQELEARGLSLSRYPERAERAGDVLRGMGRAAQDALATSPVVEGARYAEMTARWAQLPPPYQRAAHEVERVLSRQHFSADRVALGGVDALTFGVPLGFYSLVAGTGQGLSSLAEGEYEQAARELTPAVMLGALYATGKVAGGAQPRLHGLREVARRLETSLGPEGLRALAEELRARRDAGQWVAAGGVDAALALHEARGDVGRAQALLSKARRDATGGSAARRGADKGLESLASLVDEAAGLTREVVEARLALAEVEAEGPRLPNNREVLERQRPSVDAPPPGAEGHPKWREYVAYHEKRLGELRRGEAAKPPLRWESYSQMWAGFSRGLAFERSMVTVLEADAALPQAQRRFLGAFREPRILRSVGVMKPESGLRYADVLVIEEGAHNGEPRIETFSLKSRDLAGLDYEDLKNQMRVDAEEALQKYGGTLDIRRNSLHRVLRGGSTLPIQRVRLVYEGGALKPTKEANLERALRTTQGQVPGVEVSFQ